MKVRSTTTRLLRAQGSRSFGLVQLAYVLSSQHVIAPRPPRLLQETLGLALEDAQGEPVGGFVRGEFLERIVARDENPHRLVDVLERRRACDLSATKRLASLPARLTESSPTPQAATSPPYTGSSSINPSAVPIMMPKADLAWSGVHSKAGSSLRALTCSLTRFQSLV